MKRIQYLPSGHVQKQTTPQQTISLREAGY